MNRRIADAILKVYREVAEPEIPGEAPNSMTVPLLVDFKLGDLKALDRTISEVDSGLPTDKA